MRCISLKVNQMWDIEKRVERFFSIITGINNPQDESLPLGCKWDLVSERAEEEKHEVGYGPMLLKRIVYLLHLSASLPA